MAGLIRRAEKGGDVGNSYKLGVLASMLSKIIQNTEIEERLDRIEAQLPKR